MTRLRPAVQAVFFGFHGVLTHLTRPRQELAVEGADQMARWLRAQGMALPDDFAAQWLAARRFAAAKALQEGQEHTADEVLAFILQLYGCADLPAAMAQQAVDAFFAPEAAHRVLLPDAPETLAALYRSGYQLGIICNATSDRLIEGEIDRLGLRPYLALTLTSAAAGWRKPRPQIFEQALARLDVLSYEAVMVGDRLDVEGAQRAQMWGVWANGIARPASLLPDDAFHPDAVIHALPEVLPIIDRWAQEWSWPYANGEEE